jgi:hypothetical protein
VKTNLAATQDVLCGRVLGVLDEDHVARRVIRVSNSSRRTRLTHIEPLHDAHRASLLLLANFVVRGVLVPESQVILRESAQGPFGNGSRALEEPGL